MTIALPVTVIKAATSEERRYTFGPLYAPGLADAHDEFTSEDTLQKAMWHFARTGSRMVRRQHQGGPAIGEIVDHVVWPYEATVDLQQPGGAVYKATLPAGTAYVGVRWSKDAWPLVKSGAIRGVSLGGRAVKVRGAGSNVPSMKSAVQKASSTDLLRRARGDASEPVVKAAHREGDIVHEVLFGTAPSRSQRSPPTGATSCARR